MYKINSRRLKELVRARGENALALVSIEAKVGISTLEKMMSGAYENTPRAATRERLSAYFGVPEGEIFPSVASKGKSQAS